MFETGIPARMFEHVDEVGLTGIGVLPGPLRKVMVIVDPFVAPSDFEEQVVGTSGGVLVRADARRARCHPEARARGDLAR